MKNLKYLIIGAVIIVLVGAAYFVGQNSNHQTNLSAENSLSIGNTLNNSSSTASVGNAQQQNSPSQSQQPSISMSQVQITNLKFVGPSGMLSGDEELTGEVTNNSNIPFQAIDMTIEGYDCPSFTINSSCDHIAEDTEVFMNVDGSAYSEFPPNQTREGMANVNLSGAPPIKGNFLWSYTVTGFFNGYEIIPVTP